jgi:hypothetical protein
MSGPERIWLDWLRANSREYAYDEPPIKPNGDCKDAYVRADLYDALKAENERLRDALTECLRLIGEYDDWQKTERYYIEMLALTATDATTNSDGNGAAPSP